MKKLVFGVLILSLIAFVGYPQVMNYFADKMIEKVAETVLTKEDINTLMADPEVKKLVESEVQTAIASGTSNPENDAKNDNGTEIKSETKASIKVEELEFTTKEEALKVVQDKFTTSEIVDIARSVSNGASKENLKEIKDMLLSRLTPEELEALKIVALKEMMEK